MIKVKGKDMKKGKRIVVGICGGIAAYKMTELVRMLVKEGYYVRVAMTKNALHFVSPLTLEVLSGNKVIWDMFSQEKEMEHIVWAQDSDLILVAPATANILGKLACGIADDFLTTLILASTAKIMVCPAMNTQMFLNPVVQNNIQLLKNRGFIVLEPTHGELACGTTGVGRLPEIDVIFEEIEDVLSEKDLSGIKILVTAGPTREPIDPVRFISNRSSGKMGYAIARMAKRRGAEVVLISGPTSLSPPTGKNIEVCWVETAEQMKEVVLQKWKDCDVVIKAAAVADYRPEVQSSSKIKKKDSDIVLKLKRNPDILEELGRKKDNKIIVGFAAETEDLIKNAQEKLKRKNLDMIVANDVSEKDAGFGTDTNKAVLIRKDGAVQKTGLLRKEELANIILDRVRDLINERRSGQAF
jgi:phosphopantothenoylcysteine decarboxylase/phosphopantothenate--cysteine ligase